MSAKTTAAALAALLLAGPVLAAEAPAPAPTSRESILTFFRHLRDALSQTAVNAQRKPSRFGSVAAVRGADQSSSLSDPDKTTLKGDAASRRERRALAEDAEMKKGVDLILAGKLDDGIKALEAFKTGHPKSRRLAKVDEALAQAQALKGEAPAAAAPGGVPAK